MIRRPPRSTRTDTLFPYTNALPISEFERLHHKFDLVIELLGALLRTTREAMPATPLRLSGTGLFWATSGDAPAAGTLLDVSVQLHACAPTPLQWRGEVVDCRDGALQLRFLEIGSTSCRERGCQHV